MRFGFDTVLRVAPYAASKNAPDHVQRLIGKYVTFSDFRDFLGVSMQDEEYISRLQFDDDAEPKAGNIHPDFLGQSFLQTILACPSHSFKTAVRH